MRDFRMDGLAVYNGFLAGYRNLARRRNHLNRINVFPVADGDTGNNLVWTFRSIASGLKSERSAGNVLERIADLSLEGARGNSGTIFSQFLNGMAQSGSGLRSITVAEFGELAKDSATSAYRAMDEPKEGTILTVIKAWADTVYTESLHWISMHDLLSRGLKAARHALEKTPDQLDVLKENNVVDAGALGFVSFMEGVESLVEEGPVPLSFRKELRVLDEEDSYAAENAVHGTAFGAVEYRYCTELLVENAGDEAESFKRTLRGLGDSLIVGTGGGRARIHIHTNNPADVVHRCRRYGGVSRQKVDDMYRQAQIIDARAGRIAVLTDSIADIPGEVLDRYQIHVLNLDLMWDDESFLDRLTITPREFYRQQMIRTSFPGSSVPSDDRIDRMYRSLLDHYEGIVVLPVAKGLSGTWQSMSRVAEKYNAGMMKVRVVDTCLNSAAQGLLVVETAKRAAEGASLEELEAFTESLKSRVRIYVSVSTFRYMVRGGRVSPLKGLLATILNMKPIISLDARGKGVAFDTAFSRKGLLRKIGRIIRATAVNPGIERFVVVHASAPNAAAEFAGLVSDILDRDPEYLAEISPIVGMHSGKGAVAVGLIEAAR